MWKYLPVLNAMIKVLLTIVLGGATEACGILRSEEFVHLAVRFVFYVALPCLVVNGIGIGVDFYSDKFLWKYIAAFLILRVISLAFSFAAIFGVNWRKGGRVKGLGDVAVLWLSLSWISTVILGVPISTAVFRSPQKGKDYGLLAGISSFIFQLPLQLIFLECHAMEHAAVRADASQIPTGNQVHNLPLHSSKQGNCSIANSNSTTNERQSDSVSVEIDSTDGQLCREMVTNEDERQEALEDATEGTWWSLAGSKYIGNRDVWTTISIRVLKNPVLWGIFFGFVISLSTFGPRFLNPTSEDFVPELGWVQETLAWFGACVSPLSLFFMGMWMQSRGAKRLFSIDPVRIFLFMASKMFVVPLIMVGLAKGMSLNDEAGRAAVLIATLPISLASFSLGHQYQLGEAELSANVAAGTILMLPTVLLWNIGMDNLELFPIVSQGGI